jgi:hypothetical protein
MREGESEKQVLHALEDNIIVLNDARLVTGFHHSVFFFWSCHVALPRELLNIIHCIDD